MPIDTPSRDYAEQSGAWAKVRALRAGEDAARETLIKRLPGHSDPTYANFKDRAYLYPAMARTVELFIGMLFMRTPKITNPKSLDGYVKDATLDGTSLSRLSAQVGDEVLSVSRCAVLVDHPPMPLGENGQAPTRAQAEALGLRAFARVYKTESILAVTRSRIGGVVKVSQVRLAEIHEEKDPQDPYVTQAVKAVRVLELLAGVYHYSLYQQDKLGRYVLIEGPTLVLRQGKAIPYIPITFFSHLDQEPSAKRPPLADLADVNQSHFNTSALNEWGEMWCANPTPVFIGLAGKPVDENGQPLEDDAYRLGSEEAISLSADGDAKFLEFQGKGMEALRATMKAKEQHMAVIGARALADDPRAAVAAETARIQNGAEHSTLANVAEILSEGMSAVLNEFHLWETGADLKDGEAVEVNRDFIPANMSPQELKELVGAWQQGAITLQDLFSKLQKAGAISAAKTFEQHQEELETDPSAVSRAAMQSAPL